MKSLSVVCLKCQPLPALNAATGRSKSWSCGDVIYNKIIYVLYCTQYYYLHVETFKIHTCIVQYNKVFVSLESINCTNHEREHEHVGKAHKDVHVRIFLIS